MSRRRRISDEVVTRVSRTFHSPVPCHWVRGEDEDRVPVRPEGGVDGPDTVHESHVDGGLRP